MNRPERTASYATLTAVAFIAQQVAGRATRDALFLSVYDAVQLPRVMFGAAVASLLMVGLSARLMSRIGPARTVPMLCAMSAMLFTVEAVLLEGSPRVIATLNYLHMTAVGAIVISGFWSIVNERFDPHTAKKAVAKIAAGAALGGLLGGAAAFALAKGAGVRPALIFLACVNLVCGLGALRVAALSERAAQPVERESGFEAIRSSIYLKRIAVLAFLLGGAGVFFDFALKAEADAQFNQEADLLSFFAIFYTATGLITFGAQSTLAARALRKFGIGGTMALLPIGALLTGGLAAIWTRLATTALAKGTQVVLGHSFFRSGYELLYTPVAPEKKRPAKPVIDVVCDQLGDGAASVLIMAILAIITSVSAAMPIVLTLGLAIFAVGLWLMLGLNDGYVAQLASSLRTGALQMNEASIIDATTMRTYARTTQSMDRQAILSGIEALRQASGGAETPTWQKQLRSLLSDNPDDVLGMLKAEDLEARVAARVIDLLGVDLYRRAAETALQRMSTRITGQLVDALLDPGLSVVIRRRLPAVLTASDNRRAAQGLLHGLDDDNVEVRRRCAQALVAIQEKDPALDLPSERIFEVAEREAAVIRTDGSLDHVFTVLSLALDRNAVLLSSQALSSNDPNLRGTALEYLYNVLPDRVRRSLWPQIAKGQAPPREKKATSDLLHSMQSLILDREALSRSKTEERT